jgi:hypothetical protein
VTASTERIARLLRGRPAKDRCRWCRGEVYQRASGLWHLTGRAPAPWYCPVNPHEAKRHEVTT